MVSISNMLFVVSWTNFLNSARRTTRGKSPLRSGSTNTLKSSTVRILGLQDGGTGHLPKFIGNYKEETDKFEAPGLENPFIICSIMTRVGTRCAMP